MRTCAVALAATLPAAAVAEAHRSTWSDAQKIDEVAGNSADLNTP